MTTSDQAAGDLVSPAEVLPGGGHSGRPLRRSLPVTIYLDNDKDRNATRKALQVVHKAQAEVDAAQGRAVAELITSLTSTPNAMIQAGSLLVIKIDGEIIVRNPTQAELLHLERNPRPPACAHGRPARVAEPQQRRRPSWPSPDHFRGHATRAGGARRAEAAHRPSCAASKSVALKLHEHGREITGGEGLLGDPEEQPTGIAPHELRVVVAVDL